MSTEHKSSWRPGRARVGSGVVLASLVIAGLVMLPTTALGQVPTPTPAVPVATATTVPAAATATPVPAATATTVPAATATPLPAATAVPAPTLTLSTGSGLPGASITANGSGFAAGETVNVTFNGSAIGSPTVNSGGTWSLAFTVPTVSPGSYGVLAKGQTSGFTATTAFTVNAGGATLTFSVPQAAPGTSLTVTSGGFRPGETVQLTFNGAAVASATADTSGNVNLTFIVPTVAAGQYNVTVTGQTSGVTTTDAYTVIAGANLTFSVAQAAPGTSLTVTSGGFRPGETVQLSFNGAVVASGTADTSGNVSLTFVVPTLPAGQYNATVTGQTSGVTSTAAYTVLAAAAPVATAVPTPTPAPATAPASNPAAAANAPAIVHDDRYFSQTGYRIDNDDVWAFFNQYGGIATFGYPTSRQITFLGCPVQMFQRQIIQDCPGQGAALINMLDPDIFPYTQVNGSTFPAADATLKNNTPPVSSPTYSIDISTFINTNVPDMFGGQPVNFLQTFNTLGGLTIWGAPISNPQPDPTNGNFIYQRFQRGIMHYIAGQGTESILLADYLKAIIINQNVPADLAAQSNESRFANQYCPGQAGWLCRPAALGGTDLTYAFVNG